MTFRAVSLTELQASLERNMLARSASTKHKLLAGNSLGEQVFSSTAGK
jgi:hypothetical protein